MKKISCIGFITFLSFLLLTLPAQAAEPIKFGFLHSLSGGVGQVYGVPDLAGVKIAIDEINKAGGILGRPLEVISRDDKLKAEVGVREAKDLILNQKVHWIQGTVSSAVALAVSAYCKGQKTIFRWPSRQQRRVRRDIAMSSGLPPTPQLTPVVWPMPLADSGRGARRSLLSVLITNTDTGVRVIL